MKFKINWDALGIATSLACAIHCAVLPLILTSLPIFGINIIENTMFEYGMLGLAIAIGGWSLYHGYRHHHHRSLPILIFLVGTIFLLAKQVFHSIHLWLLVPAVFSIIAAHFLNFRFCRIHDHAHKEDCDH